jgi:eukaryotic-like serine/threonine-protein kinase
VGRAHSLWFCDPEKSGNYGWYEIAFMENPEMPPPPRHASLSQSLSLASFEGIYEPLAFPPNQREAMSALGPEASNYIAWLCTLVRVSELGDFIDR